MKVTVDIGSMDSKPGYVPSGGLSFVVLIPDHDAADLHTESLLFEAAYYNKEYHTITVEECTGCKPYRFMDGVCEYSGVKGIYDVPDGYCAVQVHYHSISTDDEPRKSATLIGSTTLAKEYRSRIEHYQRLLEACEKIA